jgi:hypothetical protein
VADGSADVAASNLRAAGQGSSPVRQSEALVCVSHDLAVGDERGARGREAAIVLRYVRTADPDF